MKNFSQQTIIVPFDFSAPARRAVKEVLSWADDSNTIILVHVVTPSPGIVNVDPPVFIPPDTDFKARDAALVAMIREYEGERPDLQFKCMIGDPGLEIVAAAEAEKADLIIMPSHGRTGLSRLFLGSVAERVLRLSTCPVLVLRGKEFESDNTSDTETTAVLS